MINDYKQIQSYFKENKYVVIKDFLNKDAASIFYNYCKLKTQSIDIKKFYCKESYDSLWDGRFDDEQSYGDFSYYGDPVMESILQLGLNSMQNFTGLNLVCNYSYWRLYQKDSILKAEIDSRSTKIQKMKDYQKYYETTPNYLKNEAGVLYEKNKMTELYIK
jgi:hypothetical protein